MQYRQPHDPKRQKLVPADPRAQMPAGTPHVLDLDELKKLLQEAIELEHFTIPPYLCALYSIKDGDQGSNREAYQIIRSVVMEEMLHMALAANILNAIGGTPHIYQAEGSLPSYPSPMPHSEIGFQVNLLKFSKEAINTFLRIERPAQRTDPTHNGKFWSIGEFYAAVREALNRLDDEQKHQGDSRGIFTGDERLQIGKDDFGKDYYGGGGKLFAVCGSEDAIRAIDEIVGQGEGIDGTIDDGDDLLFDEEMELAHYYRFNELYGERQYRAGDQPTTGPTGDVVRVDWDAVYNMVPNPKMSMFTDQPAVHTKMLAFNRLYSDLLRNLQCAFNGDPKIMQSTIPLMHAMRNQAVELMNADTGRGDYTAGPSFEYVPDTSHDKKSCANP